VGEQVSTAITGVRTVGVPVTDQDRAVAFHVGVLGLEKRMFALRDPDGNGLEIVA
jgi:hypothetical protein